MENSAPAYSWYDYITREDVPTVPKDNYTHLNKSIMINRGQGGNKETSLTHNRDEMIQYFGTNAMNLIHWLLI